MIGLAWRVLGGGGGGSIDGSTLPAVEGRHLGQAAVAQHRFVTVGGATAVVKHCFVAAGGVTSVAEHDVAPVWGVAALVEHRCAVVGGAALWRRQGIVGGAPLRSCGWHCSVRGAASHPTPPRRHGGALVCVGALVYGGGGSYGRVSGGFLLCGGVGNRGGGEAPLCGGGRSCDVGDASLRGDLGRGIIGGAPLRGGGWHCSVGGAPSHPLPSPAVAMVRLPTCVAIMEPWVDPVIGYAIDDATESHTHAPTSTAHPVVVQPVLMRRQRSFLVVLASERFSVRVAAVHKATTGSVRIDVKAVLDEDAQRATFLVFSPLHPGVPLHENAMHFEANAVVKHSSGIIVYEMLPNHGQKSAIKLFNRLKRETSRMSAGPANGPFIGAGEYQEAMSIGPGYSLVPAASAPIITAGRVVFWHRMFWDDIFHQLVVAVCSSVAITWDEPIDLVEDDAEEAGAGAGSGAGAAAEGGAVSGAVTGVGVRTRSGAGWRMDASAAVPPGAGAGPRAAVGTAAGADGADDGKAVGYMFDGGAGAGNTEASP